MATTLSIEEARALATALDAYLPELRFEAARIKRQRDREELVLRERILTDLRKRLG
jgi:hypothetical protein